MARFVKRSFDVDERRGGHPPLGKVILNKVDQLMGSGFRRLVLTEPVLSVAEPAIGFRMP